MQAPENQQNSSAPPSPLGIPGAPGAGTAGSQPRVTRPELPAGGGTIQGMGESFRTNEQSGTAAFAVPLPVSPNRGIEPRLSLSYESGAGQGTFGLGFGLSLPRIFRSTSLGVPRYDDRDVFTFSTAGMLVKNTGAATRRTIGGRTYDLTEYRPRSESAFARIRFLEDQATGDSWWWVTNRENVHFVFGLDAAARISDPADPRRIFTWLLQTKYDARGNYVFFEYARENGRGVAPGINERNRNRTANRYIARILYGNDQPLAPDPTTQPTAASAFHFQILFDYGGFTQGTDPTTYDATQHWPVRDDPFSDYRAGFEIRTYRLCRKVYLFHQFTELGNQPQPARSLDFNYQAPAVQNGFTTLLTRIQATAYPTGFAGQLPPIDLQYTAFQPDRNRFAPLLHPDGERLSGAARPPDTFLLDLYGTGIPGVLTSNGGTVAYQEPLGPVAGDFPPASHPPPIFDRPVFPDPFPAARNFDDPGVSLIDINGDGLIDVLETRDGFSGFYESTPDRAWKDFRVLENTPTEINEPTARLVDVDGSGNTGVMLARPDRVRVFPGTGLGFKPALAPPNSAGIPFAPEGPRTALRLADVLGAGTAQLVRVRDGSVECWPNLGYGRFGPVVQLPGAPQLGNDFDAERVFFADVSGTGVEDLIYVTETEARLYLNQSGNAFAPQAVTIALPGRAADPAQIDFADLFGTGTGGLVFSQADPRPAQQVYDFSGGAKPNLLNRIDNNRGARTDIDYASSVSYYLKDRAAGKAWLTALPFPVQVVSAVTRTDSITATVQTSCFHYSHGFYDAAERVFRGFGFVQRQAGGCNRSGPGTLPAAPAYDPPPLLTKSWYHTGALLPGATSLVAAFQKEFFAGDTLALDFPESVFDFGSTPPDGETIRQAHAALAGRLLHQEVYGLDGGPQAGDPYTVSERNYAVQELQNRGDARFGVFFIHARESLVYDYERVPADPRVAHEFVLAVDAQGMPLRSAKVDYARRPNQAGTIPEQTRDLIVDVEALYNRLPPTDPDTFLHSVPREERAFEFGALARSGLYFSFQAIDNAITKALGSPGSFDPDTQSLPAGGPRLFAWKRSYYDGLALGQVAAQALLNRTEKAVFSDSRIKTEFAPVQPAQPVKPDLILTESGYVRYTTGGVPGNYWWNPGELHEFNGAAEFYTPAYVADALGGAVAFDYDRYFLIMTKATAGLVYQPTAPGPTPPAPPGKLVPAADVTGSAVTVKNIDYLRLRPTLIRDENDNMHEVVLDSLGRAVYESYYKLDQSGKPIEGFQPLTGYTQTAATVTAAQIIAGPDRFLKQAARFFFYDALSFTTAQPTPNQVLTVSAREFTATGTPAGLPLPVALDYADGTGGVRQRARLAEAGPAYYQNGATVARKNFNSRWQVTERKQPNDRGETVHSYLPFYFNDADFVPVSALAQFAVTPVIYYDAPGRPVKTTTPFGDIPEAFFSKSEFSAWSRAEYDADDTLKDAAYFRAYIDPGGRTTQPPSPQEVRALKQAALFYDTPTSELLDPAGRVARLVRENEATVKAADFESAPLNLDPAGAQKLFKDLRGAGILDFRGALTPRAQNPQGLGALPAQFTADTTEIFQTLRSLQRQKSELVEIFEHDIQGFVLSAADPRLGAAHPNIRTSYTLQGVPLTMKSVDAGDSFELRNAAGKPVLFWNGRKFLITIGYDTLGRITGRRVDGGDGAQPLAQFVERIQYGDTVVNGQAIKTDAADHNLNGRVYRHFDEAGFEEFDEYDISGKALNATRRLLIQYQREVDWQDTSSATMTKLLEPTSYRTTNQYDALGRMLREQQSDGATPPTLYFQQTDYLVSGRVQRTAAGAGGNTLSSVTNLEYDAGDQELTRTYGNGIVTLKDHDPQTRRLKTITTTLPGGTQKVQALAYTYDPVGNVAEIQNGVNPPVFHAGQFVSPDRQFVLDALYRLVSGTGRRHTGLATDRYEHDFIPGHAPHLNNASAQERYTREFAYDTGGNLTGIKQIAATGSGSWTNTIAADSNRGIQHPAAKPAPVLSQYFDAAGNQTRLLVNSPADSLVWNFRNDLQNALVAGPGREYYQYDAAGRRRRKVNVAPGSGGGQIIVSTLDLGLIRIQRTNAPATERQTLILSLGGEPTAITHRWTTGSPPAGVPNGQTRYQLDDRLGSISLEYDANAGLLSYEEYYPFGGTAFLFGPQKSDVSIKEFRYSGQELDATGLYYFGARYYMSWSGRWTAPDPDGPVDGLNLFAFVNNNPITLRDIGGFMDRPPGERITAQQGFVHPGQAGFVPVPQQVPQAPFLHGPPAIPPPAAGVPVPGTQQRPRPIEPIPASDARITRGNVASIAGDVISIGIVVVQSVAVGEVASGQTELADRSGTPLDILGLIIAGLGLFSLFLGFLQGIRNQRTRVRLANSEVAHPTINRIRDRASNALARRRNQGFSTFGAAVLSTISASFTLTLISGNHDPDSSQGIAIASIGIAGSGAVLGLINTVRSLNRVNPQAERDANTLEFGVELGGRHRLHALRFLFALGADLVVHPLGHANREERQRIFLRLLPR